MLDGAASPRQTVGTAPALVWFSKVGDEATALATFTQMVSSFKFS